MSIAVVGSLHLDVVMRAPRLPKIDETVTGSGVAYVFGGKGGNQAVAAARLGARVSFAGRAGRDAFGDVLRDGLIRWGVDISQLQDDTGPSGMSAAIVDAQGDYGAVIVSAANLKIETAGLRLPPTTQLLLLQNEIPEAVNIAVAKQARAIGAAVWLNAAPARPVSAALLALVDLMIVNRVEAAFYADHSPASEVMTTLGAAGVAYAGQRYPTVEVDVISTHGAGDMFVGALASRVADGARIAAAIPFAQAAAAWHISRPDEAREKVGAQELSLYLERQVRP